MDVNCGGIADGSMTIEERGEHIYRLMLRIASGERSKASSTAMARTSSCRGRSALSPDFLVYAYRSLS